MDAYPEQFKHLEGPVQLGTTTITFRARSPTSKLNEVCRMTITAVQQQPPEVVYCPESFTIQLDERETARLVYWKEPAFRATGHLKQLYKSKQPGDKFTIGEHYVSYVATDGEGQSSKCNFKVTLKGMCGRRIPKLFRLFNASPSPSPQKLQLKPLKCRRALWLLLPCWDIPRQWQPEWQIMRAICCARADNQCRFLRITM